MTEEDHEEDFFVVMSTYLRENDFHEIFELEEHEVVWSHRHLDCQHIAGARDGLIHFVRTNNILR